MRTTDFFVANPVFSLDDAVRYLAPPRGRLGAVERLKHHLETGRLKLVMKGVYAVAPAGVSADRFHPNPFLVASAVRPDAIFSHHSALDLLGTAHSLWHGCTVYTAQRRRPFALEGTTVQFLDHPGMLKSDAALHLGTRKIEHRGKMLETTGPERTLLEGFRRPGLVGGLEELVNSAAGFPIQPGGLDHAQVRAVSQCEVVTGKLLALLDRGAPRDAWDVGHLSDSSVKLLESRGFRERFVAMSAVLQWPLSEYGRERLMHLMTDQAVGEQLLPMLSSSASHRAGALLEQAWLRMEPLLSLQPHEQGYVAAIHRGELRLDLLFPDDPAEATRLAGHPAIQWKIENVRAFRPCRHNRPWDSTRQRHERGLRMALNPIVFTEKVVRSFLRYQLTAYPFA